MSYYQITCFQCFMSGETVTPFCVWRIPCVIGLNALSKIETLILDGNSIPNLSVLEDNYSECITKYDIEVHISHLLMSINRSKYYY